MDEPGEPGASVEDCAFCGIAADPDRPRVVYADEHAVAIWPRPEAGFRDDAALDGIARRLSTMLSRPGT